MTLSLWWAKVMLQWARLVLVLTALFHAGLMLGFDWLGYADHMLFIVVIAVGTTFPFPRLPLFWSHPQLRGWQVWSMRLAWLYVAYNFVRVAGGQWLGASIPRKGLVALGYFSGIMPALVWISLCMRSALLRETLEAEAAAADA